MERMVSTACLFHACRRRTCRSLLARGTKTSAVSPGAWIKTYKMSRQSEAVIVPAR